jgi:hypothetical protein
MICGANLSGHSSLRSVDPGTILCSGLRAKGGITAYRADIKAAEMKADRRLQLSDGNLLEKKIRFHILPKAPLTDQERKATHLYYARKASK